jgi:hypothetical protein
MKHSKIVLAMLFGLVTGTCFGQATSTKADNTKVNKRDRNAAEVTADQQKVNATGG